MPNRILNSVNMLYTPNIEDVKSHSNYASPNTFVVTSYVNNGTYLGFEYYSGLSYELYYINQDKSIQQLTYNLVKGNGLFVKDNLFTIKLDNSTLVNTRFNNKNYVKVNTDAFKEASYLNRGLLSIENDLYYNDKYYDVIKDDGAFTIDNSNNIALSNGLNHDLIMISEYYNKCNNILSIIKDLYKLCITDLDVATYVNVGDILYYNNEKKIYTLKKQNKNGTINKPVMVCVIASNVLDDGEPRFMPLKRKMNQYIYDKSNTIYLKNAFNQIPIYSTNDTENIGVNTNVIGSTYGHIAIKRNTWKDNINNPLDDEENYYISNNKTLIYNISEIEEISSQLVNWYVDASKIDYNNNYVIMPNGVYTDIINESIRNKIGSSTLYIVVNIEFSNNIKKYYICNLKLSNNRFVNLSNVYGYNLMKTITNNFAEASSNASEQYYELVNKDNKESSKNIIESTKKNISFSSLKTIIPKFTEDSENASETYVISNDNTNVSDTDLHIYTLAWANNKYEFSVKTNANGQVLIYSTQGILNKSQIIVKANITSESIIVTNQITVTINPTITVKFIPDDPTKYKSVEKTITHSISPIIKTVNTTIVNAVTTNSNNNINTNSNTKTPSNVYVVSDNKIIYESSNKSGGC